jgi:hypothetical protein
VKQIDLKLISLYNIRMSKKWKCKWCLKQFDEFEGFEKYRDIKCYNSRVMNVLYNTKKDNDFFNHLEVRDGLKRAYCSKAYDWESSTSFKNRSAYYRFYKKHRSIVDKNDNDLRRKLKRDFERKINHLIEKGHEYDEFVIDVKIVELEVSESESTNSDDSNNLSMEIMNI